MLDLNKNNSFIRSNFKSLDKNVKPDSIKILLLPILYKIFKKLRKSFLSSRFCIFIILHYFFLKKEIFFLSFDLVKISVCLCLVILSNFKFLFNFNSRSIINKSGWLVLSPSSLQFKRELSSFIDFEVEIIESYFDLKRWVIFSDLSLVIRLLFLLIVKKSLDMAILASIKGKPFFLL